MHWVQTATVQKDGQGAAWTKRSIRLRRGDEEAVIWYKDATITLVRVHHPPTFDSFVELERWLATNPNTDLDTDNDEILYYREIAKFVIRHGHFTPLLEVQGADQAFSHASFRLYKSGHLAREAPVLIAAFALDALSHYQTDRRRSLELLAWMENECRSKSVPASSLKTSRVTAEAVMHVYFLSMAAPIILSGLGPFYYGYTNSPYWRVIVWALACTIPYLWWARSNLKSVLKTAPPSLIGKSFVIVTIAAMVAAAFLVGNTLVYLVARAISSALLIKL